MKIDNTKLLIKVFGRKHSGKTTTAETLADILTEYKCLNVNHIELKNAFTDHFLWFNGIQSDVDFNVRTDKDLLRGVFFELGVYIRKKDPDFFIKYANKNALVCNDYSDEFYNEKETPSDICIIGDMRKYTEDSKEYLLEGLNINAEWLYPGYEHEADISIGETDPCSLEVEFLNTPYDNIFDVVSKIIRAYDMVTEQEKEKND